MPMQNITIRPAVDADLPAIIALLADDALGAQREVVSDPPDKNYLEAFAAIDSDANQHLAVLLVDNAVSGCLQLTLIPGLSRHGMWRGQIESVRVGANIRGQGLGRKLFDWAIDFSRQAGCGMVQLTADKARTDAHRFYNSLGFTATHEGMKLSF